MFPFSGAIFLNPHLDEISVSGLSAQEFLDIYNERTNRSQPLGTNFAPNAYDAVWALALALNRTVQKMTALGN